MTVVWVQPSKLKRALKNVCACALFAVNDYFAVLGDVPPSVHSVGVFLSRCLRAVAGAVVVRLSTTHQKVFSVRRFPSFRELHGDILANRLLRFGASSAAINDLQNT